MKYSLLILSLVAVTAVYGQTYGRRYFSTRYNVQPQPSLAARYADSLRAVRARLDTAVVASTDSAGADACGFARRMEHYDVLMPLTFYHGVARRMFSLDSVGDSRGMIDRSLMSMYLRRPEMVYDTSARIQKSGGIAYKPQEPVKNDIGMTNEAEEEHIIISNPADVGSQVSLVTVRPNFWKYLGDYSLQFIQNYVSGNWYKGGTSSYSMIGATTLQFNYNDKEKIKWDNKLEMKFGLQSAQGDSIHNFKSSEDLIRFTSKLGVQASHRWYYTLQGIFSTQFAHGYKSNDPTVYSDFLSPLNANLSLGMDYKINWLKGRLTGTVNISPIAANLKYVDRLALSTKYGIDEGHHTLWDIGSTFTTDINWKFSNLISLKSRLYAYTTYHRTEVEWENTLNFQLSKYISTQIFVYPRYDDSTSKDPTYGHFQLKEYWSLGFSYSL